MMKNLMMIQKPAEEQNNKYKKEKEGEFRKWIKWMI